VKASAPSPAAVSLLVIGYGNTLRSDDGAGPRAAEAVEALGLPYVSTIICHQLTPELADPISRARTVVFVDASAGDITTPVLSRVTPADSLQLMAHASSPEHLLALARRLFGNAPTAWMLALPAKNFDLGETLSPLTESAIADAVAEIRRMAGEEIRAD
jgi:hydrogenase maturation protease